MRVIKGSVYGSITDGTILTYILFGAGFPLLVFAADFLVKSASALARRLRVPDLVIGLTVVAFGTSAPELFVNVVASARGDAAIALGNIIGSNILVILGIAALIFPLSVTVGTVYREIPLCLLASLMAGILSNDRLIDRTGISSLTRIDGIVLTAFFAVFLYHVFDTIRSQNRNLDLVSDTGYGTGKIIVLLAGGLFMLYLGSVLVVDGAEKIAAGFGVSQSTIALTVVACGTSVPELATSTVAAAKRKTDIAVGNIVGSNIFNVFFILGTSAIIRPVPLTGTEDNIGITAAVTASLLLFVMMFTGRKYYLLERWEGAVFIALYSAYLYLLLSFA